MRTIASKIVGLFRSSHLDSELEAEIREHLSSLEERFRRQGMSADEARYAARRTFGGVEQLKETNRDHYSFVWLDDVNRDLRLALRSLRRNPGFTIVAVLTLALAIGVTAAIFEFVDAGLIHALPYREPDRLVHIAMTKQGEFREMEASYPNFLDWQTQNTSFESLAGYVQYRNLLSSRSGTREPVNVASVSANFFSTLGVATELGRSFTSDDGKANEGRPAVISYACWQRRFGERADILGQAVTLGSDTHVIVGILPRWFEFAPVGSAEMFVLPPVSGPMITRRNLHWFQVIGRLKSVVTRESAYSEMTAISNHLAELYPQSNAGTGVNIVPLREIIVGKLEPVLSLLFAAAGAVLLLACANVANLLLGRSTTRRQEIATRLALGARRGRIVRQTLTENILLALIAGCTSLFVTRFGIAALLATVPASVVQSMPFLNNLEERGGVVLFTTVVALIAGILFGFAPTLNIPDGNLNASLQEAGRNPVAGRYRLRRVLIVSEIAIAAALLIVSGLLLKTVWRVAHTDPGFNRHNLLLLTYALPPTGYADPAAIKAFQRELERRVGTLPGVTGVAQTSMLPLADCNGCNTSRFAVEGKPVPTGAVQPEAVSRSASQDYFGVLQARLLKGRALRADDYADRAASVVIVNRALQDQYFDGNAVGKHLTFTFAPGQPAREVVGVVDNFKEGFLDAEVRPALYLPIGANNDANILVRTSVEPSSVANTVRNTILEIEPNLALFDIMTMDARVANSTTMFLRNLPAVLMTSFGLLSLVLAAIGIYGVISYSVAQRTREFGVRMALGASSGDLLRLVLGDGLRLSVIGIAAGMACAAIISRAASSLLFDVRLTDFASFAMVPLVVVGIAAAASFIPAQRTSTQDPMSALRYE